MCALIEIIQNSTPQTSELSRLSTTIRFHGIAVASIMFYRARIFRRIIFLWSALNNNQDAAGSSLRGVGSYRNDCWPPLLPLSRQRGMLSCICRLSPPILVIGHWVIFRGRWSVHKMQEELSVTQIEWKVGEFAIFYAVMMAARPLYRQVCNNIIGRQNGTSLTPTSREPLKVTEMHEYTIWDECGHS